MAISDTAVTLVGTALSAAGFAVRQSYTGSAPVSGRTAFISADKAALSGLDSEGGSCRAEVTVTARLCAAEKGFFGAAGFSELCEGAVKSLYFGSGVLISRAELSALKKNMQLGRLERTLTVTVVYTLNGEEAQT
jgi:hypothetical protein